MYIIPQVWTPGDREQRINCGRGEPGPIRMIGNFRKDFGAHRERGEYQEPNPFE